MKDKDIKRTAEHPEGSVKHIVRRAHRTQYCAPGIKAEKVEYMSGKIRYTDEPLGKLKVVSDFLPRPEDVIPENELWLHQPQAREDLQRALGWARRNSPKESHLGAIPKRREDDGRSKGKKRKK